ncbi:ABC transporter ATP-binding protein [Rubripirellula sp.]|nr:ABC transporter ATP-binding protein [Rubripirellula sp.]MDB4621383.1 ABC transporter ATP-binding protein [Rubripirellula sp.]
MKTAMSIALKPYSNFRKLKSLNTHKNSLQDQNLVDSDETYWALKDLSFDVGEGQVLGILGPNGAGKSTLLKVLSRITHPTRGRATLHGRVSSLLEVGTGFHPELTGRENVYMNGTILGMTKKEIDRKFEEIIDFSGIERFLDTPTKRWSSGMRVRLAFAVAAHLEPEILIIDEVLAVGDAEFQKKCLGQMKNVAKGGRTVLFVSHNMAAISLLCDHAILLRNGKLAAQGETQAVIAEHINQQILATERTPVVSRTDRSGDGTCKITSLLMTSEDSSYPEQITAGKSAVLHLQLESQQPNRNPDRVRVACNNSDGLKIWDFDTGEDQASSSLVPIRSTATFRIPNLCLAPGNYLLDVEILKGQDIMDRVEAAYSFDVECGDFHKVGRPSKARGGVILLEYEVATVK